MKCATGEVLRKRTEMLKSLKEGMEASREARIQILDYEFQKEIMKYKEGAEEIGKIGKNYDKLHDRTKKVYDSVVEKIKKYTSGENPAEVIKIENGDMKYNFTKLDKEKLEELLKDQEEVQNLWEKLLKTYEESDIKGLVLDKEILKFDFNRMERLEEYRDFSKQKLEEYKLVGKKEPSLFEKTDDEYNDLLHKLSEITFETYRENPKALTEYYNRYKQIVRETWDVVKNLKAYSSDVKREFRKHKASAENRSKTLEKKQEELKDMIIEINDGVESKINEKEKKYVPRSWLYHEMKEKSRKFGSKMKNYFSKVMKRRE